MYNKEIIELFTNHTNSGRIIKPDAIATINNIESGQVVELSVRLDEEGFIEIAKFQSFGSPILIAASNAVAQTIVGLTLDEAENTDANEITEMMGDINEENLKSISIVLNCVSELKNDYIKRQKKIEKSKSAN